MENTIQLVDLDFEFKLWKNELQFLKREVRILQKRIEELLDEGIHVNSMLNGALNEQFLDIEKIENKIKIQEEEMAFYINDYPINKKHAHYLYHEELRTLLAKLKKEQQEFITTIIGLC